MNTMLMDSEKKYQNKYHTSEGFHTIIDCRWSSQGFNAEKATVICCKLQSGKIIYQSHLMHVQNKTNDMNKKGILSYLISFLVKRNYTSTSKRMEGERVIRICMQIIKDKYKITSISHDNDVSTMSHIKKNFLLVKKQSDIGHAAKNLCKKVKVAAKEILSY